MQSKNTALELRNDSPNASNFWDGHAEALIHSVGEEFLRAASLDEVTARAGEGFSAMSENTRSGVFATARALLNSQKS